MQPSTGTELLLEATAAVMEQIEAIATENRQEKTYAVGGNLDWELVENLRRQLQAYGYCIKPNNDGSKVTEQLWAKHAIAAFWEYPGYVSVDMDNGEGLSFGIEQDQWLGNTAAGESFELSLRADASVELAAEVIYEAIRQYSRAHNTAPKMAY